MAPANPYLMDQSVQQRLAEHNNRLIKSTTTQFPGEEPETHWDFNRPVELELLNSFLSRYAAPDFADGRVTTADAVAAVYGSDADDYLTGRLAGHLKPGSTFNRQYSLDGLVYVGYPDGHIARDNRHQLALAELEIRKELANERLVKKANAERRGLETALRRAKRIDPEGTAELDHRAAGDRVEIGEHTQLALGIGSD